MKKELCLVSPKKFQASFGPKTVDLLNGFNYFRNNWRTDIFTENKDFRKLMGHA